MDIDSEPLDFLRGRIPAKQIAIEHAIAARAGFDLHAARRIRRRIHDDIFPHDVGAVGIPNMRTEKGCDVVLHHAEIALAALDAALQADISHDLVIRRSVVEVDVVAIGALQAVVAQRDRSRRVQPGQPPHGLALPRSRTARHANPIAVAAPGVERAMLAGGHRSVENVVPFDGMPAPAAIVDVDCGAGDIVNGVVADGDRLGLGDEHAGDLLFDRAQLAHPVVLDQAASRIIAVCRPGLHIHQRMAAIQHLRRKLGKGNAVEGLAIDQGNLAHFVRRPAPGMGPARA
ncbi:MAG: hypothetical protein BWZ10_03163 [candidate division BRC1 bacterium ADurb.BinA364]|nr:MAG: hypothetical protein BWZ10_03163 [candidate division BRC1 bacterium ADurb.BinA364]